MGLESYSSKLSREAQNARLSSFSGDDLAALKMEASRRGQNLEEYVSNGKMANDTLVMENAGRKTVLSESPFSSVATFEVRIVRAAVLGIGFPLVALPVPIGLPYSYQAGYKDLIPSLLPSGSGIGFIGVAIVNESLVITYADAESGATLSNTVTITCSDVNYIYWLAALSSNYIQCNMLRMTVNSAETDQFQNSLQWYGKSNFGNKFLDQKLSPARYVKPAQNQANIADVTESVKFTDTQGFVCYLAASTAAPVSLNFFVKEYSKPTL